MIKFIGLFVVCGFLSGCIFGGLFGGGGGTGTSNLSAMGGNTSILLQWTDIANASSYNLYKTTAMTPEAAGGIDLTAAESVNEMLDRFGAAGASYGSVSSSETVHVDEGLTNGMVYCYVVTGLTQGETAPSQAVCQMPLGAAEVTALARSLGATLTWESVPGAAGYNLYWKTVVPGIIPFASVSSPGASFSASKAMLDGIDWDNIVAEDSGMITVEANPDASTVTYNLSTESNCLDVIAKVVPFNSYRTELSTAELVAASPQTQGDQTDDVITWSDFSDASFVSAEMDSEDRIFATIQGTQSAFMKYDPSTGATVMNSDLDIDYVNQVVLLDDGSVLVAGYTETGLGHLPACELKEGAVGSRPLGEKLAELVYETDDYIIDNCYVPNPPHIKVCRFNGNTLELDTAFGDGGCYLHPYQSLAMGMAVGSDGIYVAGSIAGFWYDGTGVESMRFGVLKLTHDGKLDRGFPIFTGAMGTAYTVEIVERVGGEHIMAVGDSLDCELVVSLRTSTMVCDSNYYRVIFDSSGTPISMDDRVDGEARDYTYRPPDYDYSGDYNTVLTNIGPSMLTRPDIIQAKDLVQLDDGGVLTLGYQLPADRNAEHRNIYLWREDVSDALEIPLSDDIYADVMPEQIMMDCRGNVLVTAYINSETRNGMGVWRFNADLELDEGFALNGSFVGDDGGGYAGASEVVLAENGFVYIFGSVDVDGTGYPAMWILK